MKGFAFLVVGVAIGFVAAAFVYKVKDERTHEAQNLTDDIERRFGRLELEPYEG